MKLNRLKLLFIVGFLFTQLVQTKKKEESSSNESESKNDEKKKKDPTNKDNEKEKKESNPKSKEGDSDYDARIKKFNETFTSLSNEYQVLRKNWKLFPSQKDKEHLRTLWWKVKHLRDEISKLTKEIKKDKDLEKEAKKVLQKQVSKLHTEAKHLSMKIKFWIPGSNGKDLGAETTDKKNEKKSTNNKKSNNEKKSKE